MYNICMEVEMKHKELFLDTLNRMVKLEKEVVKLEKEIEQLKSDIMPLDNKDAPSSESDLDCTNSEDKIDMDSDSTLEKKDREQNELEQQLANLLSVVRTKRLQPRDKTRDNSRDKTRYMFNGNVYPKNRLVLAVVKDYVVKHKGVTCRQLKTIFDKSLQGSIGVVEYEFFARQRKDCNVRFFAEDGEILRLIDGNMVVCSQWGIFNIVNFTKRAEKLGYEIEPIS